MDKNKILAVIFCITLPLFLLLLSYKITLHFTGLTADQENTISFLTDDEDLKLNYTANEVSHLEDVRKVMEFADYLFYFLLLASTLILTYHLRDKEQTKKLLRYGGIATVLAVLLILFFSLVSFSIPFTAFHLIFFPQGNWTFPADSLLIQTFHLEFFIKMSWNIFIQAFLWGMIFILLSYFLPSRQKLGVFKKSN